MNLSGPTCIINTHGRLLYQSFCRYPFNIGIGLGLPTINPTRQALVLLRIFSQEHRVTESKNETKTDFRVFQLRPESQGNYKKQFKSRSRQTRVNRPPRTTQMSVEQDWPSVWPGPRSFHPASVPLPIRQGYVSKGTAPGKFANAELLKIPNFLHLTPPAVKRQCKALKQFCTTWPAGLDSEAKCKEHFPLEVITSDYVHSSPVIRNPLSRIVSVKIALSTLPLDSHARDKMLRLVGERYNSTTDEITIVADRCPLRQQNYDLAMYILTALFHECWKVEPWESEKSEADMEYYDWNKSISRSSFLNIVNWPRNDSQDLDAESLPHLEYQQVVSEIFNVGEGESSMERYKEATKKVLLPTGTQSKPLVKMQ